MVKILVPISAGDLVDRITILEIKTEMIPYLVHIRDELEALLPIAEEINLLSDPNIKELREINRRLWKAENVVRRLPNGDDFIRASHTIIELNERRSMIKQRINFNFNSEFSEAKNY